MTETLTPAEPLEPVQLQLPLPDLPLLIEDLLVHAEALQHGGHHSAAAAALAHADQLRQEGR